MPNNTPPSLTLRTKEEQILRGPDLDFQAIGKLMDRGSWVFRLLDQEETEKFQKAAQADYTPFSHIEGIWHPVYQLECVRINHENSLYRRTDPEGNPVEELIEEDEDD